MDPSNQLPRCPPERNLALTDDERVVQARRGSFPASAPPPWSFGREQYPHPHQDDPDGGDNRERGRRRRHID
jgi:hypothetical protein